MARQESGTTDTTELEAAVLGVVWQEGPCTPYAIRQHFLESRAPRWSGSAGAIYPLVRRLETRGLVRSTPSVRGRRAHRDFRITRHGGTALKRWVRAPISLGDGALIHDPLRTRMLFLSALPREEALSFVSDALGALRRALQQAQKDCREKPVGEDQFAHFAARNALLVTRARVKWLAEVQGRLKACWGERLS